jgi:hypothetical protein
MQVWRERGSIHGEGLSKSACGFWHRNEACAFAGNGMWVVGSAQTKPTLGTQRGFTPPEGCPCIVLGTVYNWGVATGEPESNCYPVESLDLRKGCSHPWVAFSALCGRLWEPPKRAPASDAWPSTQKLAGRVLHFRTGLPGLPGSPWPSCWESE